MNNIGDPQNETFNIHPKMSQIRDPTNTLPMRTKVFLIKKKTHQSSSISISSAEGISKTKLLLLQTLIKRKGRIPSPQSE